MTRQYHDADDLPSSPPAQPTPSPHPLADERRIALPDLDKPKDKPLGKPIDMPRLHQGILAQVFGFSYASLDSNREGRLADPQRAPLHQDVKEEGDSLWLMLMIFLGMTVFLAIILLMEGQSMGGLVIGAGGMIGALLFYSTRRQNRRKEAAESHSVRAAEGQARLDMRPNPANMEALYGLMVGEERFALTREQFVTLAAYELPRMKVYYILPTRRIVSAEILGFDEGAPSLTYKLPEAQEDDEPQVIYVDKDEQQARR
ncbi:MAG: hypothetical protein NZ750_08145 [Anaerolineae bacterium]|nr:hypothetical protein [Anaerolineae bacterium]MDW8172320.1 hypothetical protein [Anaerolineae bacterium]